MTDSGWRETTVGILCDEGVLHTQTGPFGSQLHSYDYVPSGVPVVPTEGIGRRRLLTEGIPEVAEETAARLARHRLKAGDILFARRGVQATGLSAIVTPRQEGWLCGTGAILLRIKSKAIDPEFLSFFLSAEECVLWLKQHAVGAVMPNLNEGVIRQLPLVLPPLAEQKAIAAVLGALDDGIELNRRMNATLAALARALFQSWFVDFDPVRAKLDGRKPLGLDESTAALFPAQLEDSPLGHIPRGWEVRTIEGVCKTVTRGVTPEYGEGTGRFIINQKVNRGADLDWASLKELSQGLEVPTDRFAKRWDVLVNCLGEGTLGRTHLYKGESNIYAIDQHMSICRAEHGAGGAYIYQVLSGADGQAKIESLKTGTTGMTMFNISKLRAFELVWPAAEILGAYFKTVEPLWLRIANNDRESRTLTTLRDTLLPKLLSGELPVDQSKRAA